MPSKSASFIPIALALAIGPSVSWAKDAGTACFEGASTQSQMTDCSAARAEENRRKMQENAHEIKRRISNRARKLAAFEKAQKAWEDYAQAEIDFLYLDHAGSAAPMCENDAAASLMNQRAQQLKTWVSDSETEGNICGPGLVYDPDPMPSDR